jgi:hypothetical protein
MVIGFELVPLALTLRLPVHTPPRMKRTVLPAASGALLTFASVRQAVPCDVPAAVSLPLTLST